MQTADITLVSNMRDPPSTDKAHVALLKSSRWARNAGFEQRDDT